MIYSPKLRYGTIFRHRFTVKRFLDVFIIRGSGPSDIYYMSDKQISCHKNVVVPTKSIQSTKLLIQYNLS